jgi:site-specific recombinase XerD
MKVNQNLSILFWVWKDKIDELGKAPIYVRLTIDGMRSQFSLGLKVKPSQFNVKKGQLNGTSEEARTGNNYINLVRGKLQQHYNILSTQFDEVSPDMVRNIFLGKTEYHKTLVQAFNYHNEQFEQKVKAGLRAKVSLGKFSTTLDHIKNFLKKEYNLSDIPLANIKHAFAEDFEHYLTTVVKMQNNSAMKHIRNTKKVLLLCMKKEWITKNPIAEFSCTYHHPEREILMEDELEILRTKEMPSKRLDEVRDCYVAMCYTGYAYKDAASLSPDNIQIMIDGNRWLLKNRSKTECKENVPILPVVADLIDKYKNHLYCMRYNKLFPIRSNQKFNDYLKEVAAICGIEKDLTTHTARHTFATTVTLCNGVPIETVSALLGHSSIRTTQIYAKVVAQKVIMDMDILREKLAAKTAKQYAIAKVS